MKLLKTSNEIKKELGEDYRYLVNKYDIKFRERKATEKERKQLNPRQCAACGRKTSSTYRLETAHITPLAECSRTNARNILLLCRERHSKRGKGCHTLYDQGFCSIVDMVKCQKDWLAKRPPSLRKKMESLVEKFGHQPQQQGYLRKMLNQLCEDQKDYSPISEDWHSIQVQIAELTRRRPYTPSLIDAWSEILKVNPKLLRNEALLSRYYYQKGYIELLSGRLVDALDDFLEGREILELNLNSLGNRWRWAAHTSLLAQVNCIKKSESKSSQWSWSKIREELTKALKFSQEAVEEASKQKLQSGTSDEFRHSSRWVQNCLVHLIKPEIAQRNLSKARKQWDIVYENWLKMDISSGWDAGSRPTLLWIYGKLLLEERKNDDAITHLVRALVLLIGLRRQQPEGIRDLLFTLADALEKKGDTMHKHVRSVALRCYEFSSWFNPYV